MYYMNNFNVKEILDNFSNNNITNITAEGLADVYYARDLNMNLNFDNQFDWAMKKLCYHPSTFEDTIVGKINHRIKDITGQYLENKNSVNINLQELESSIRNNFINEKTSKLNKFNRFNSFLDTNDHRGFYNAMTREELDYLGF